MIEAEWLVCDRPGLMLQFLRDRSHDRKLRLFAVACCRRVWDALTDEDARRAVVVAERLADGHATRGERRAATRALSKRPREPATLAAACAVHETINKVEEASAHAAALARSTGDELVFDLSELVGLRDRFYSALASHAPLLRDIFGNPFRPVPFSPSWRTSTAVTLATQMYESRDFGAMPILADALQDAGCDCADVLDHCRGPGPHVRGCWVVDLVLGKE
ncbi:hypothetical protein VT84_23685 [Gemmata sp. SH-PL17]|uniref:hypothetical protein n=1 Tax=Gemmata sp. SH-PL17 TaxID=1630693 RepID=UPI0004BCE346|nr:hypothetical protein [Gemmata sp. SH-PL17]AMV27422.1 hypothetical protein VT84_23685 [Gemmata sp. SH-PL17]